MNKCMRCKADLGNGPRHKCSDIVLLIKGFLCGVCKDKELKNEITPYILKYKKCLN